MPKILIVEDDLELAEVVSAGLTARDYTVEHLTDGTEALYLLKYYHFDLAILDWEVPGISGVDVCKEFRKWGGKTPILMLTGRTTTTDKEVAFDIGADDYLTKPFEFRELAARIRALLRRPPDVQKTVIDVGRLSMNLTDMTVTIDGQQIKIKAAEFELLELFMKSPGRLFTLAELLNKVFPSDSEATDNAVRQRIFRLRRALGEFEWMIESVSGYGYKLNVEKE
jgi:OmpR-family two-component system manganese-sensing response regulator